MYASTRMYLKIIMYLDYIYLPCVSTRPKVHVYSIHFLEMFLYIQKQIAAIYEIVEMHIVAVSQTRSVWSDFLVYVQNVNFAYLYRILRCHMHFLPGMKLRRLFLYETPTTIDLFTQAGCVVCCMTCNLPLPMVRQQHTEYLGP